MVAHLPLYAGRHGARVPRGHRGVKHCAHMSRTIRDIGTLGREMKR
jgi:hypothetical protein